MVIAIISIVVAILLALFMSKSQDSKAQKGDNKRLNEQRDQVHELGTIDDADRMGKELDPAGPATIPYEKTTIGKALEKAWETFRDPNTTDIIELDTDTTGCQLSVNNQEEEPYVLVEYVFKTDLSRLSVPDYIREKYDGGIVTLSYRWPEEKDLLIDHIQEVLGGTMDSYVRYHYWDA